MGNKGLSFLKFTCMPFICLFCVQLWWVLLLIFVTFIALSLLQYLVCIMHAHVNKQNISWFNVIQHAIAVNSHLMPHDMVSLLWLCHISFKIHSVVWELWLLSTVTPWRETGRFLMSPLCLESQGCQFDPTFLLYISSLVLLPSPVVLSVWSFSAFGPFSWSLFP